MPDVTTAVPAEHRSRGWVIIPLLICSLAINVLLSRRISILTREAASLKSESGLNIGTKVPPIEGRLLNSTAKGIEFGRSTLPTVIYVFSPDCGWCMKNLGNLRALIAASGTRYTLVGLSLPSATSLSVYLQMAQLHFPVYTDVAESTIGAYRLGGTPETIVVSPQSKVLKVWIGAYQGAMLKDVENYLGVPLRECCQTVAKGS